MTDTSLEVTLRFADENQEANIGRLFSFVRIPSISADPAYRPQCQKAAEWIAGELRAVGCETTVRETPGCPMVVGHYSPPGANSKMPHVLFYGHYDVQPADPQELWTTPAFEPVVKTDGRGVARMYGRGTADDKGQLMTFVEAARALVTTRGALPIKATFLIEGEEESGSPSLVPFLKAHVEELSCDVAFVCDSNMWDARTPAITTRLRGLVHEEVTLRGPAIDLHSGMYGGPAVNPLKVMSRLIASLHDAKGKVTIKGFYDGVRPLPAATRKQWRSLKFSEKAFLGEVGLKSPVGERGMSVLEQIWARPTAEVNGLWGGYQGAGSKTVIPSEARAKFTFRLVGQQKPEKVLKAFQRHVRSVVGKEAVVSFSGKGGGSPASEIAENNVWIKKSSAALKQEFGRETVLMGSGGSIPIVRFFKDILGMDSVLVGFGLNDDAIHSPNEKYNVSSFTHGIRSWIRIMDALGK
jgi:acetylornithine deacetylase/succinyl-diaminopimelate desuccinylase-like protein